MNERRVGKDKIYRDILQRIRRGEFDTQPLPSENQLATKYGCSRGTVRSALLELERKGLIYVNAVKQRVLTRAERLGDINLSGPSDDQSFGKRMERLGRSEDEILYPPTRSLCRKVEAPRLDPMRLQETLEVEPENELYWFCRVRLVESKESALVPLVIQWTVIPESCLQQRDVSDRDLVPGGLRRLYQDNSVRRTNVEVWYSCTNASLEEARDLHIQKGAPLLMEERTSKGLIGSDDRTRPYEYLLTLYTSRVRVHWQQPFG